MLNEILRVKDFSVLKDIKLEIKNFTIILGEQASGKSVLAKLVFFFQQIIPDNFIFSIIERRSFDEMEQRLKNDFFKKIFPEYFWESQDFEIEFKYKNNEKIRITRDKNSRKPKILISYSKRLEERYDIVKNRYFSDNNLNKIIIEIADKTFNTYNTIFTPATRSIFSLIKENIFALSMLNVSTDFFINQFGMHYEKFKALSLQDEEINNMFIDILKGEFYYDQKRREVFIYRDKGLKVRLQDSSTGQQELVPIFILLTAIYNDNKNEHFLIIEEPGSHLFPSTQKRLIELFAYIFNFTGEKTRFLFTTHTPYILSSLNNLIEAGNIQEKFKDNPQKIKELNKIIPGNKRINFDKVSAYIVKNGKLKSLLNQETKLIEADDLDAVSEQIAEEFDNLLNLNYE